MQLDILICRQCDHDSKFLGLRAKIVLRMVKRAREKPFFGWLSGRLGGQIEYLPVRPPRTRSLVIAGSHQEPGAPEASPLPMGEVGSRAQRGIRVREYDADTTAPSPGSRRKTQAPSLPSPASGGGSGASQASLRSLRRLGCGRSGWGSLVMPSARSADGSAAWTAGSSPAVTTCLRLRRAISLVIAGPRRKALDPAIHKGQAPASRRSGSVF